MLSKRTKRNLKRRLQSFRDRSDNYSKDQRIKGAYIIPFMKRFGKNAVCYYTGDPINLNHRKSYTLDHIYPISRGGKGNIANLGLTSSRINQMKADMTEPEFLEICEKILTHKGYKVEKCTI